MKVRLQPVNLITPGKESFGHHQVIAYGNFTNGPTEPAIKISSDWK